MTPTGVTIRPAKDADIGACLAVEASEGNVYFTDGDLRRSLVDRDTILHVAEADGTVVGFVSGFVVPTKPTEALIHSTMVHREHRGRGIGSALVHAFALEAFNRRVKVVFAEVETGPDRFYASCGFHKEAEWNSYALRREELLERLE